MFAKNNNNNNHIDSNKLEPESQWEKPVLVAGCCCAAVCESVQRVTVINQSDNTTNLHTYALANLVGRFRLKWQPFWHNFKQNNKKYVVKCVRDGDLCYITRLEIFRHGREKNPYAEQQIYKCIKSIIHNITSPEQWFAEFVALTKTICRISCRWFRFVHLFGCVRACNGRNQRLRPGTAAIRIFFIILLCTINVSSAVRMASRLEL